MLPLGSLMEGWRTDDPRTRRDLLAVFFDELTVFGGQIVEWVRRQGQGGPDRYPAGEGVW